MSPIKGHAIARTKKTKKVTALLCCLLIDLRSALLKPHHAVSYGEMATFALSPPKFSTVTPFLADDIRIHHHSLDQMFVLQRPQVVYRCVSVAMVL